MAGRGIDGAAARRRFERSAATVGRVDVLAREVERRMAARLDLVRHRPRRIVDAGCGTGSGAPLLGARYPEAEYLGIDFARNALRQARRGESLGARLRARIGGSKRLYVCADLSRLPLRDRSAGLLWSNLALAWAADPSRALAEFSRVLDPGGLLMFSTYGPDTLKELRDAFRSVDAQPHLHAFDDMHDLGDLLLAAGFADPVMDMELMTLSYADVASLVRDLRESGQTNVASGRRRGLMARTAWDRMVRAYESLRRGARLPATFEIVYGHAWKGATHASEPRAKTIALPRGRKYTG